MSEPYSATMMQTIGRLGPIVRVMHEDGGLSRVTRTLMREHTGGYSRTTLIRVMGIRWEILEHVEKEFK